MKAIRYSASAGSGKTYTLTEIYLNRALQSPRAFAGILALTFTNKAANELKIRILKAMKEKTQNQPESGAEEVLFQILHHYEQFQVGTIDSFFQNLFTRFAYEAELPYGMALELDTEVVKEDVLEEGLLAMPEDLWPVLVDLLLEEAEKNKGRNWRPLNFTKEKIIQQLFTEKVLNRLVAGENQIWDETSIQQAQHALEAYLKKLTKPLKEASKAILDLADANGFAQIVNSLEETDAFLNQWRSLQNLNLKNEYPSTGYKSFAKGKWHRPPKSCSKQMLEEFEPFLLAYSDVATSTSRGNYTLANNCLNNLKASRLLIHFRQTHTRLNQEENRFLLEEVKYLLRGVIGDSEVPYLFERLGTSLNTLLIDEFQDTNLVQWEVMRPLAKTILENRGQFVAVGDVKQSIYRWRGANSTLFSEGLIKSLAPISVLTETLDRNYRSEGLIVKFNNQVFSAIPELYQNAIREKLETDVEADYWAGVFKQNYSDVEQRLPDQKAENGGFVEFRMELRKNKKSEKQEPEENPESAEENLEDNEGNWNWLIKEIYTLHSQGIPIDDIAVLVRKNSEIEEIAEALDHERKTNPEKGTVLRFSASQNTNRQDHLFFDFVATCLVMPEQFDAFRLEKIRVLAFNLGISELSSCYSFQDEAAQTIVELGKNKDILSHFLALTHLLKLDQKTTYQKHLVAFENLLFEYMQSHRSRYADFDHWWKKKGGQAKLGDSDTGGGIQITTIHKAKGLDYGVVILPGTIPLKADLIPDEFWFSAQNEPWNSFPFMSSKGKKELLDSDLASDFIKDIYLNELENLNTWYVGCTRPRYGLIIHVRGKVSKSLPLSNIPVQMLELLKRNIGQFMELHPESRFEELLDEDGAGIINFKAGVRKAVLQKEKNHARALSLPYELKSTLQPEWRITESKSTQQAEGIAFHKVLENCLNRESVHSETSKISHDLNYNADQKRLLSSDIDRFMKKIESWDLFLPNQKAYTEREVWSKEKGLLRVDRIENQGDRFKLVDFKTGEKSDEHLEQLRQYQSMLSKSLQSPVSASLIYSQLLEKTDL